MKNNQISEKIELANSCGVRLVYCQDCQLVQLEVGAITINFCPEAIQRIANVMMKASLQLDHIIANKQNLPPNARQHLIH